MKSIIRRIFHWSLNDGNQLQPEVKISSVGRDYSLRSPGMMFHLYPANGGTVIETTSYDRVKDEPRHRLYIISDDQDFTQVLSEIVSMERLKS